MKWKLNSILIGIIILGIIVGNIEVSNIGYREFRKIRTEIKNISWQRELIDCETRNYTLFTLNFTYQLINIVGHTVEIPASYSPAFYFDVLAQWEPKDKNTNMSIRCGSEVIGWPSIVTINDGITNGTRIVHMKIHNQNVTSIPDGKYIFWIGFGTGDETHLNPTRCKLLIKNGKANIRNISSEFPITFNDTLAIAVSIIISILLLKRKITPSNLENGY